MTITLELPQELETRFTARDVVEAFAVEGYRRALLSQDHVEQLLGLDAPQTQAFLQERNTHPHTNGNGQNSQIVVDETSDSLNVRQAARLLHIPTADLLELVVEGKIAVNGTNGNQQFSRKGLRRYMERETAKANAGLEEMTAIAQRLGLYDE